MLVSLCLWVASVLLLSTPATAQCNVTWLYPPAGLTINYNDTITAAWTSDCAKPDILVWGPSGDNNAQILWDQTETSSNGTLSFSFVNGVAFRTVWPFPGHFEIEYNATADYAGVDGAVFSITSTVGVATTYALSTTHVALSTSATTAIASATDTSTTASSTQSSSPSSTVTTPTSAATTTSSSSGDDAVSVGDKPFSTGAKIGLGVGIGGGILLLILGIWAWRRFRKRNYAAVPGDYRGEVAGQKDVPVLQQEKHELDSTQVPVRQQEKHELYSQESGVEMGTNRTLYELHGISRASEQESGSNKDRFRYG